MAGPTKQTENKAAQTKAPQSPPAAQPTKAPEPAKEAPKAPPASQDLEEDFDDEEEDLEDDFDDEDEELEDDEEPAPDARPPAKTTKRPTPAQAPKPIITEEGAKLVKKEAGAAKLDPKYQPRIAFELDKKGQKVLDEEGEPKMLPAGYVRHVGYVNESGVLFPVNFRFRGGHVADSVEEYGVVLNKCPRCGYRQNIDEAVQGECQNMKSGAERNEPCGFSAYEELDSYELAE